MSKNLLVHLVLISLLTKFDEFKITYNCQEKIWSLNDLILHNVQEEEILKIIQKVVILSMLQWIKAGNKKDKEIATASKRNNKKKNQMNMKTIVVSLLELYGYTFYGPYLSFKIGKCSVL